MKTETVRTGDFPAVTEAVSAVFRAKRSRIRAFKSQPRRYFDPERLKDLADSMKAEGQVTPIEVKELVGDKDADYELVDGERRYLAAEIADLPEMLCWVKDVKDEEEQFIRSVMANFGREGHTPLETARAIKRIMSGPKFAGLARTECINRVAKIFAKSASWVYQHEKLLTLHPKVQRMCEPETPEADRLSFVVAQYLNNIHDQELQLELATTIVKQNLSPNKARALIRKAFEKIGLPTGKRGRKPYDEYKLMTSFIRRLSESAEIMADMKLKKFEEIFRRNPEERRELVAKIDQSIEELTQIRQGLARLGKK